MRLDILSLIVSSVGLLATLLPEGPSQLVTAAVGVAVGVLLAPFVKRASAWLAKYLDH